MSHLLAYFFIINIIKNFVITVPPRIAPFNFESDITEGMRTHIMCSSSTGDHPFNITWLKNHQIIYNSNLNSPHGAGARNQKPSSSSTGDEDKIGGMHSRKRENSYSVDSTINISDYPPYSSILTIENLTSNDNGNYTCQISNHGGIVEHTAVLSVAGLYIFHSCCFSRTHQAHQNCTFPRAHEHTHWLN